jgi:chromosome segregation ATPase
MPDDTVLDLILTRLERIASHIDALPATLLQHLSTLREMIEKLTSEHSKTRSEIMDRIDRLQETVDFVRDDVRVNWATADIAINRTRNSREDIDDLHKLITAMERRFQTLSSLVDGMRKPEIKKPDDQ